MTKPFAYSKYKTSKALLPVIFSSSFFKFACRASIVDFKAHDNDHREFSHTLQKGFDSLIEEDWEGEGGINGGVCEEEGR